MDDQEKIDELSAKLEALIYRHKAYTDEIRNLRNELNALKGYPRVAQGASSQVKNVQAQDATQGNYKPDTTSAEPKKLSRNVNQKILGGVSAGLADYLGISIALVRILMLIAFFFYGIGILVYVILWIVLPANKRKSVYNLKHSVVPPAQSSTHADVNEKRPIASAGPQRPQMAVRKRSNLEKFIGEKIISIVGIAITIIGAGIGVKYSIEHELISPTARIILGYVLALGLLGVGIFLKKKYELFSAILVSGSMAIFYFITFAAYSFYGLYPQTVAFGLMFVFTALTVFAAMLYNQQVISIIGLVGAYSVPFLLSDGSGRVEILFSYVAIINIGVLIIAFRRFWKPLFFSAFALTWIIYLAWFLNDYDNDVHAYLAFFFASIYFFTFYAMFLAYKLFRSEQFELTSVVHVLSNAFIYYGIGYAVLNGNETGEHFLGLFTLLNALVHGVIASIIYAKKDIDRNIYYLISGLAIVFVTIAIPVELDGSWVTLLWSAEAALLFWIGRSKQSAIYEQLSYPVILIAFISLLNLWGETYRLGLDVSLFGAYNYYPIIDSVSFFLNSTFLSSVFFVAAMAFITRVNFKSPSAIRNYSPSANAISGLLVAMLIGVLYLAIYLEVAHYFGQLYAASFDTYLDVDYPIDIYNTDILLFKNIALILYTMVFLLALSYINQLKAQSQQLGKANILFDVIVLFIFLLEGLYALSELRDSFLVPASEAHYPVSSLHIGIRYVSIAVAGVLLWRTKELVSQWSGNIQQSKMLYEGFMHLFFLWIISSEVINLMTLSGTHEQYKLSLSILWGLYSLMLIVIGIWKQKPYLRFGAIGLFSVTLIKLFFYDISHLNTISKTIVFVSLGILLLVISFLYNKFKSKIDVEENE